MSMLIVNKRMIIKVFYIAIGVFCVLTTVRCQGEAEQKTDLIYYRKCCEENQVYEVTTDECLLKHEMDGVDWTDKNIPVNLVHGEFSVYDYILSAYPDIETLDDLQQVSEDYSILGEFQNMNTLTSQRSYINGYGLPNCKMKGAMKTWMNKHNESHSDGVHYHHFVITKALTSKSDDMVKVRLYHFDDFNDSYHTIEYFSSKDYCLDTAYRYSDNEKENGISYYGTVAKICHNPPVYPPSSDSDVRLCCEVSNGKFKAICPSASPDDKITSICNLCDPNPDLRISVPFEMILNNSSSSMNNKFTSNDLQYIYGIPNCETQDFELSEDDTYDGRWQLYPNGRLRIGSKVFNQTSYCFNYGYQTTQDKKHSWIEALVCTSDDVLEEGFLGWQDMVDYKIISALNCISVLSLIVVLLLQWQHQKQKLFGALQLSTVFMLLLFNVTLTVVKLQGNYGATESVWVNDTGVSDNNTVVNYNGSLVNTMYDVVFEEWPKLCYLEGLFLQYSFLSTLLWLNVMAFDVWLNFRRLKPNSDIARRQRFGGASSTNGFCHPRYIKYAIYALVIPLLNLSITVLMDSLPSHITEGLTLPGVGTKRCAIQDHLPTLLYWHCVTIPVLLINTILFGAFVKGLCCGIWANSKASRTATIQRQNNIKTAFKMFITLGIPYVCDLIAWSVLWAYGRSNWNIFLIASILKGINASQGFFILCVMYLDGSKVKSMYNKTMSVTTRQTFVSSFMRKITEKDFSINASSGKDSTHSEAVKRLNVAEDQREINLREVFNLQDDIELT